MITCIDCAKLKRENERLQAEVIRLAQNWLELKKFIINQERTVVAGKEVETTRDKYDKAP